MGYFYQNIHVFAPLSVAKASWTVPSFIKAWAKQIIVLPKLFQLTVVVVFN